MNRTIAIALAAVFGAASLSASGAELTDQDRSELRQRAQEFQNERARNPDFQPGQGRINPEPADTGAKRSARATKAKAAGKPKETRRQKAAKKVRSLKKIPGAFVRR
jgi:hypothetical protein